MARVTCTWRTGVFVKALAALIIGSANVAFAQPTLQFELVKYDYPAAPSYAQGEPEYYQRVLVKKGGPVVPGWLVANWLWSMVPTGKKQIPTACFDFYVYDLVDGVGVAKIRGCLKRPDSRQIRRVCAHSSFRTAGLKPIPHTVCLALVWDFSNTPLTLAVLA